MGKVKEATEKKEGLYHDFKNALVIIFLFFFFIAMLT